jgi:hypothetical protein
MSRSAQSLVAVLVLALSTPGCAKKAALPGAVYAQAVAVYAPAQYDGAMGGRSGDLEGAASSESMSWFFTTTDPKDKVVAFYEAALPGATQEVADGEVTFTFVPAGADPGEQVQVIVRDGQIQIHESTRPGKHTDPSGYDKAMDEAGLGFLK